MKPKSKYTSLFPNTWIIVGLWVLISVSNAVFDHMFEKVEAVREYQGEITKPVLVEFKESKQHDDFKWLISLLMVLLLKKACEIREDLAELAAPSDTPTAIATFIRSKPHLVKPVEDALKEHGYPPGN